MADTQTGRRPLSDMIQAALDEPGVALRSLAARTVNPETGREVISKDLWRRLSLGQKQSVPSEDELEWIARGLRKPASLVKAAAAKQWLGYEALHLSGYDDDMRRILIQVESMDSGQRRELRASLEASAEERARD